MTIYSSRSYLTPKKAATVWNALDKETSLIINEFKAKEEK